MSVLTSTHPAVNAEEPAANRELPLPQRGVRERELLQVLQNLIMLENFDMMLFNMLILSFGSM